MDSGAAVRSTPAWRAAAGARFAGAPPATLTALLDASCLAGG